MGIARNMLLWGSQNRWIENQFRRRRFAKKAVSRFMPGEDVDSALAESRKLAEHNITTILTYLGENVSSIEDAREAANQYVDLLDRTHALPIDSQISVKLTQLGLDIDKNDTARNLERIVGHASSVNNIVWVDMEASNYVDATIDVFRIVRAKNENVGLCLQAYLHRTPKDQNALLSEGAAIRLVKGAYQEPADVAMPRKRDVDAAFLQLSIQLAEHPLKGEGIKHGVATHDMAIINELSRIGKERQWSKDAYEVLMLYGIRTPDQLRLVGSGVPMRVLISYGEAWFAWYVRRLAERPANVGFVLRSMFSR
jgi:proline dehydrogenase